MGSAGSGKSTQGKLLKENFGFQCISSGALLRKHHDDPEIQRRMEEGELLGNELVEDIIAGALELVKNPKKTILDGFPRSVAQAEWLNSFCGRAPVEIDGLIHIEVDKTLAKTRLLERGRTDDHEQAIDERFKEYEEITVPIIEYFRELNVPIYDINGDQPIDLVHEEIADLLELENVH